MITRGELCVVAVGLGLGLLTVTFGRTLLSIYSPSDAVIDAGMERLKIIAMTYALCGAMDVMVGSLRGMGCSVTPMLVSPGRRLWHQNHMACNHLSDTKISYYEHAFPHISPYLDIDTDRPCHHIPDCKKETARTGCGKAALTEGCTDDSP